MARASQICNQQGCPEFVTHEGRCTEHQRDHGWGTSEHVRPRGWEKTRKRVLRRDRYRCVICGRQHGIVVDHLLPMAWGGTEAMGNLRLLCRTCNMAKVQDEGRIGRGGRDPEAISRFIENWRR